MRHNVRRAQLGDVVDYRMTQPQWYILWRDEYRQPLTRAEIAERKSSHHRLARALERAVPGLVVDRPGGRPAMGGAVPWQLDGTWHGQPCYLRFRHDTGGMTVWSDQPWGTEVLVAQIWDVQGDEWAGSLDDDEVIPFVLQLVEKLAPPSTENTSHATDLMAAVEAMVAEHEEARGRSAHSPE